jgi:hypothetical protein
METCRKAYCYLQFVVVAVALWPIGRAPSASICAYCCNNSLNYIHNRDAPAKTV